MNIIRAFASRFTKAERHAFGMMALILIATAGAMVMLVPSSLGKALSVLVMVCCGVTGPFVLFLVRRNRLGPAKQ